MIITTHGKTDPLFKGVARHSGMRLVFFGQTLEQVKAKEQRWLLENMPVSQPRERKRPALRVISGGRGNQSKQVNHNKG